MNYTVKLEGRTNERCQMDFGNEKEARKYAEKLATLKKYAYDRLFTREVVIYSWEDGDSEMTELDRIPFKEANK